MPIPFTCPHCGAQTNVADEYAGQSGPCAHCGQTITVPAMVPGHVGPAPSGSSGTRSTLTVVLVGMAIFVFICGGGLVALLLPAVGGAGEAARRAQCTSNLKMIAVAMHNYHDTYGCFPPAYVPDENGKPMHSWRVLILPYFGYDSLYRQYNFDEPWDSPSNQALANRMPREFQCPSNTNTLPPGQTAYLAITGPGTVFEGAEATSFREITDGTSNTLMIIEAPGTSVNWLEPRDITAEELSQSLASLGGAGPAQGKGCPHPGGFNAAFCDGLVRFMSDATNPETLRLLIQKSDGRAIDYDRF